MTARPVASVVVPVYNEGAHIDEVLDRLRRQTIQDFEAIFADGRSDDDTKARLLAAAAADPRIVVVDNPDRLQSAGLNRAMAVASSDVLIRLDGHAFIGDDYIERCLDLLRSTNASVVGGRMVPRQVTGLVASAIGLANRSWWGAGPARFHHGGEPGPADTVYLGSFVADRVRAVGGWAEDLWTNEDYELNHRLRKAGGVVWLDPSLEVGYQPRTTLTALARQYFRYGRYKPRVLRRHPESIKVRQLVPAFVVPALAASAAVAPWAPVMLAGGHLGALVAVARDDRSGSDAAVRPLSAVAGWVMHTTWSAGFWVGVAETAGAGRLRRTGGRPATT